MSAHTVRRSIIIAALREHGERHFNSGMVTSLQYGRHVMSFLTFVLAISRLVEKVHHCRRSLIPSSVRSKRFHQSHAGGQFSISAESPISRCLTPIQLMFSDLTPVQPMRRSIVSRAIYPAVYSHVMRTGALPGLGKLTSSFLLNY